MATIDHIAVSVADPRETVKELGPVLELLGARKEFTSEKVSVWRADGPEILFYRVRDGQSRSHEFGAAGWQHLAFKVATRGEVFAVADCVEAVGLHLVRSPKFYPRYQQGYFAVYFEDSNGLRFEVSAILEDADPGVDQ